MLTEVCLCLYSDQSNFNPLVNPVHTKWISISSLKVSRSSVDGNCVVITQSGCNSPLKHWGLAYRWKEGGVWSCLAVGCWMNIQVIGTVIPTRPSTSPPWVYMSHSPTLKDSCCWLKYYEWTLWILSLCLWWCLCALGVKLELAL